MGHLFLQLQAFTGLVCLLSESLLGYLLCDWPLGSVLSSPFAHLPSEEAVLIYSLVPGM